MLSFEAWGDGFILTVEGKRLLRHSRRSPCLQFGRFRGGRAGRDGRAGWAGNRTDWLPLRDFCIRNRSPDLTVIDFGVLALVFSYEERVLRMRFECSDSAVSGIRIRFGARPGEKVYGGGFRSNQIDLKNRTLRLPSGEHVISSFMTDGGDWMKIASSSDREIRFSAACWDVETSTLPDSISLGFARNLGEAFEGLSSESVRRQAPPLWLFPGAVLDCRGMGAAAVTDAVRNIADSGVRIAAYLDDASGEPDLAEFRRIAAGSDLAECGAAAFESDANLFPGLKAPGLLSHSFSAAGYGYLPVDAFPRTKADFERWLRDIETAAFGPVFMVRVPAAPVSPATQREAFPRLARASEQYSLLESYHRECARVWAMEGLPPYRSLALHYPEEASLWVSENQIMYGRDILVAPAMEPKRRARTLLLPHDRWIHLWSSRVFGRGEVTIDAPPGRPAVFYRESSPFSPQFDALRRQAVRL